MELSGVAVRYGRRSPWVLQDVTLSLPSGALVEVTGRNGAGKSSLLRVLAGVLRPAAGRVSGRPRVVGWAPERFPPAQQALAGDYLLAMARARGLGDRAALAVGREAERLGLGDLLGVPLAELSKGSAQKIGLAQALLAPPGLLVLDEPWSGLDAGARDAVPDIVKEITYQGGAVAVADHQQQVAALAPDLRWHAEDRRAVAADVAARAPASEAVGPRSTVEVDVPAGQVDDVLRLLRGRGLSPRTR